MSGSDDLLSSKSLRIIPCNISINTTYKSMLNQGRDHHFNIDFNLGMQGNDKAQKKAKQSQVTKHNVQASR